MAFYLLHNYMDFIDFDHIFFIRKLLFVKGYKSAKTIVLNSIKMETVQA